MFRGEEALSGVSLLVFFLYFLVGPRNNNCLEEITTDFANPSPLVIRNDTRVFVLVWFLCYWWISLLQYDQRKKANYHVFHDLNLDDCIVQLKFTDHELVAMSTSTCCQKITAFCYVLSCNH